ncbi:MAG: hypothetical protein A2017_16650 [Lentisphaerae bacterium GWF2_44_16]|nr:MAG: hypothetical protein A2017_16650 [Lentisphaerae bacterium GWF2_44_16]
MTKEKKKFEEFSDESNILSEFLEFLKHNKKFWMLPIIIILLLFGLLIILGGTSAAPFIYALF